MITLADGTKAYVLAESLLWYLVCYHGDENDPSCWWLVCKDNVTVEDVK